MTLQTTDSLLFLLNRTTNKLFGLCQQCIRVYVVNYYTAKVQRPISKFKLGCAGCLAYVSQCIRAYVVNYYTAKVQRPKQKMFF